MLMRSFEHRLDEFYRHVRHGLFFPAGHVRLVTVSIPPRHRARPEVALTRPSPRLPGGMILS